jgi:hypothetical protein
MSEVTRILEWAEQADSQAEAELLPLGYDELRKLAAAKMANEAAIPWRSRALNGTD